MATTPKTPKFTKPKTTKPKGPALTKTKKGKSCRSMAALGCVLAMSGCATTGAALGAVFPSIADELHVVDCLDSAMGPALVNMIASATAGTDDLIDFLTNGAAIAQQGFSCLADKYRYEGEPLQRLQTALQAKLDDRKTAANTQVKAKVANLRAKAAALPSFGAKGGE